MFEPSELLRPSPDGGNRAFDRPVLYDMLLCLRG